MADLLTGCDRVERALVNGLPFVRFAIAGLGKLAGATGPLGASVLKRVSPQGEWLVVNTGVYMTINHLIRSVAYGLLGFAFPPRWQTITVMSVGMIGGAWLGTRMRKPLPQEVFERVFKWLITILALRMVCLTVLEVRP